MPHEFPCLLSLLPIGLRCLSLSSDFTQEAPEEACEPTGQRPLTAILTRMQLVSSHVIYGVFSLWQESQSHHVIQLSCLARLL